MGTLHRFPGEGPARRALSGNLATMEQRLAAATTRSLTYPQDILWAVPGDTRLCDADELAEAMPQQYRCVPITRPEPDVGTVYPGIMPFVCVIAGGVVTFGAERFGADLIRAGLAVVAWIYAMMGVM